MIAVKSEKGKRNVLPCVVLLLFLAAILCHYLLDPWGFYYSVSREEAALRSQVVAAAQAHLGKNEADGTHRSVIDLYNAHKPLAEDYAVAYTDSWCAVFVSAVAIELGLTRIIPTECSCQRQIALFEDLGRWEESDGYIPLPGDIIYYDWNEKALGDCTGWSDHVGIVVGVKWPFIKVIEGNKDDSVSYRILCINHIHIRGYGLPDYASIAENTP